MEKENEYRIRRLAEENARLERELERLRLENTSLRRRPIRERVRAFRLVARELREIAEIGNTPNRDVTPEQQGRFTFFAVLQPGHCAAGQALRPIADWLERLANVEEQT